MVTVGGATEDFGLGHFMYKTVDQRLSWVIDFRDRRLIYIQNTMETSPLQPFGESTANSTVPSRILLWA